MTSSSRWQCKRRQTKWSARNEVSTLSKSSIPITSRRLEARQGSRLSSKQRLVMVESQHEMSEKAQNEFLDLFDEIMRKLEDKVEEHDHDSLLREDCSCGSNPTPSHDPSMDRVPLYPNVFRHMTPSNDETPNYSRTPGGSSSSEGSATPRSTRTSVILHRGKCRNIATSASLLIPSRYELLLHRAVTTSCCSTLCILGSKRYRRFVNSYTSSI